MPRLLAAAKPCLGTGKGFIPRACFSCVDATIAGAFGIHDPNVGGPGLSDDGTHRVGQKMTGVVGHYHDIEAHGAALPLESGYETGETILPRRQSTPKPAALVRSSTAGMGPYRLRGEGLRSYRLHRKVFGYLKTCQPKRLHSQLITRA